MGGLCDSVEESVEEEVVHAAEPNTDIDPTDRPTSPPCHATKAVPPKPVSNVPWKHPAYTCPIFSSIPDGSVRVDGTLFGCWPVVGRLRH